MMRIEQTTHMAYASECCSPRTTSILQSIGAAKYKPIHYAPGRRKTKSIIDDRIKDNTSPEEGYTPGGEL